MQGKEAKAPSRKKEYNEISIELRKDAIRQSAISNRELLHCARQRGKVDLSNTEQVERAIDAYFQFESQRGNVPNFEALCCFMGLSSAWVYEYLGRHSNEKSAEMLEQAKQSIVANRISLADARIISEVFSIFVLKNSRAGYTDRFQVDAISTQRSLLDECVKSPEEIKALHEKYITGLPDADEE